MKRKIWSIILIIATTAVIIGGSSVYNNIQARAEIYRNGYALLPQKQDATGIDTKTGFLLSSKEKDITIEQIQSELRIQPEISFKVEEDEKGFLITLDKELEKNYLVTLTFREASWTFQTMSEFKVMGTLPRNETTEVPVNTGIEIYFSHDGARLKDYFDIQPKAEGRFETHGNVVVFVPKALKEKTIYTITLKEGLTLKDSEQTLKEPYTFSFETAVKDERIDKEPNGYFNFSNSINEFGTEEVPKIPMNYRIYKETGEDTIKAGIYAYPSADAFIEALDNYRDVPIWSYYGLEDSKISTETLSKVITFEQPIDLTKGREQFLNIPESLPAGYYIVDCTWDDNHFQTMMQVTDISFYYMNTANQSLVWLNDLKTGKTLSDAKVTDIELGTSYKTNTQGVAEIKHGKDKRDYIGVYKIEADTRSAVLIAYGHTDMRGYEQSNRYWRYLQTDRVLYQPDDTIELWGFLKNRYDKETIDEITVELAQGGWYYWDYLPYYGQEMPYVTETLKVDNGFYDGKLQLPNLEEGNYQINIKVKDKIISSSTIQVENYVKPAYQLEISKDKEAVMIGDTAQFQIATTFFEGTPVANLDVHYSISGMTYDDETVKTDLKGNSSVSYTPKYDSNYQGIVQTYFSAYASLPESGQIHGNQSIRVFVNDIHVDLDAKLKDNTGELSVLVHDIVLDRLNNATAEDEQDFLGQPSEGRPFTGTIYKNVWNKKEVGEYYDYINKVVRKEYEYYKETTQLQSVNFTTDKEGKAKVNIPFPKEPHCYYTAELSTTDKLGRMMKFELLFGERWTLIQPERYDSYQLHSEKEEFDINDTIEVSFVNYDKPLEEGNYLYVAAQNGIRSYDVTHASTYSRTFDTASIPNIELRGVCFNGKTYIESEAFNARINLEESKINFTVETDKTEYKPGEVCTVKLKAVMDSSEGSVPVPDVFVNMSMVDEAMFQLRDQTVDTLSALYEWVPDGIYSTYGSHCNQGHHWIRSLYNDSISRTKDDAMLFDEAVSEEPSDAGINIRSDFKDTALFQSMRLNDNGEGTLTFKLPDNVTAWRMTFAGISQSLKAGTTIEELRVTLPFFINTSLTSTYLEGDKPYIGVTAYGNALKENETIDYEVRCDKIGYVTSMEGEAYERINIPLWELEEGIYPIIIKALTQSGYGDGLEQTIQVVKTYHQIETADYYELTPEVEIKANQQGMTTLTFVDKGRGQFIPQLYALSYQGGKRIDQKYIAYSASELLKKYFGSELSLTKEEVNLSNYQTQDGGYAILPYAQSDIETTVKLLPIIKENINTQKLKHYLYNVLKDKNIRHQAAAAYGLTILEEPILLELTKLSKITNLNLEDHLYLALAYAQIGADYEAGKLYEEKIQPYVETYQNTARVKYGQNEDGYLGYTGLAMLLASKLELDEKDKFYDYVTNTHSKEVLVSIEKLTYIMDEIEKRTDESLTIIYSYDGKTYEKKIERGWPVSIRVPSSKLNEFKIKEVEGEAAVVAIDSKPLDTAYTNDDDLQVNRTFYNYSTTQETKTFDQSDIVKVVLSWKVSSEAIDRSYSITDYVPSGLKPIENTWQMGLENSGGYCYRDIEGQKVSFYISRDFSHDKPLYYYARVVTPGTYKAEGTIIQGNKVKESMFIGDDDNITIQ